MASCIGIRFNGHGFLPQAVTETTCIWPKGFIEFALQGANSSKSRHFAIEAESEPATPTHLSLDRLPVEILTQICRNLCMHCRCSHIVDVSPEEAFQAHEEQQALSRLSRTSRWLRLAAQPILFHYYHSQTHPDVYDGCSWENSMHVKRNENETLEGFVRTILERPHLAKSVKALSFFAFRSNAPRDLAPKTRALFRRAGKIAGFKEFSTYEDVDSKWLQEVAIMMTPFLEQLLLHRTSGEGLEYLKDSPHRLPKLKYLVLPGRPAEFHESYHIQEMQDLLVKAENLDVLAASDCDCGTDIPSREWWRMEAWTTPLSNLRTLSLHGLDPENVAKVLRFCPALDDFEYFCDLNKYTVLQPEHLDPVRDRLRRICYTGTSWENAKATPSAVADLVASVMSWDPQLRADFSFGNFPKLEVLEVEQMLLYGPVFSFEAEEREARFETLREIGPELFMATLPGSLQILHIGMVLAFHELYRDLLGMSRKLYRFPNLRIVAVDLHDMEYVFHDEDVEYLTAAFAAEGVQFRLGYAPDEPFARGMMGPRPGHAEPSVNKALAFPLELRDRS
ncbi:Fc.00g009410.m01.CDS01 [Cosmosporella sp. VM-42]